MSQPRRVHYVLSTHWDREWFLTQQDYRYRLVQLLDRVLDGLASGELRGPFTTDGQSIPLEDYLEIRAERRAQVQQLLRAGKLVTGPWYVQPDEFLVSGEALIRNLKLGRQYARDLGGQPSSAGFVCDQFGHNSQLPQILAGFGIHGALVWRGVNQSAERHFRWQGADGTETACYRFGSTGYCDYAIWVRFGREPGAAFDAARTDGGLDWFLEREAAATKIGPILLFDGCDHQEWDQAAYKVLAERLGAADEHYAIVHTTLDDYLKDMLAEAGQIKPVRSGELREPGAQLIPEDEQWVIPGVLSSRVWIKQTNAECQALLCQWAEPLTALAQLALGKETAPGFLAAAWRWLLQNHPHDSMGGCSLDAVHEDMRYRFAQSRLIAGRLATEASKQVAASVTGAIGADELRVVVFNPLPQPLRRVVELDLQIPTHWPSFNEFFGYEPKPGFRIFSAEGQELAYQRLGQAMSQNGARLFDLKFPQPVTTHHVQVCLPLDLPALGYTTLTVRPAAPGEPTRHPQPRGLATSERSLANEFIELTVLADGTLSLLDRRSGQTYTRLLTFEDCADIGDGWYHGQAVNEQVFVSTGSPASVALVHDGPYLSTLRVRTRLSVPASFDFARMRRSEELIELALDCDLTLRAGAAQVECELRLENTARDHRLRCLFPSGAAAAETYLADSPFDVVERPIALARDNYRYRELETETRPQQSWSAVTAGGRGLAVVARGLMETAVRDLPERPLALTLFRATRRTVFTNGEPNGQLLGPLSFSFWLAPLAGTPDRAALCQMGQLLGAGLREVQLTALDAAQYPAARQLPPSAGYIEVSGPVVMTSARWVREGAAEAGLEVRLFNPNMEPATATINVLEAARAAWQPTTAQRVDFEGNALGTAEDFGETGVQLAMRGKEIVTVRVY
jgi:alpha-mannosidase